MNKTFVLLDKNNNLQKSANVIVKFSLEGKDYLIYSVEENELNSQIFVSRYVLNSEGKIFIDNISPDERGKLNNIVYNIVILVPSDAMKGSSFDSLSIGLADKFGIKLSLDVSDMEMQEYYSNCSVAITSKVLVDNAVKLYYENLNKVVETQNVPTWTAPVEATAPVPTDPQVSNVSDVVVTPSNVNMPMTSVVEPVSDVNVQPVVVNSVPTPAPEVVNSAPVVTDVVESVLPNPQIEKLAIVSDPSLGIGTHQPNVMQNKKAGFANTKYIVIGTVCLVLAVAVVITAYILISNMK